jgi:VanZ family protein
MSNLVSFHRPVPKWALPFTRIIFVVALIVLTYYSLSPATDVVGITNFDKVMHAAAYFILAGLFALALPDLRLLFVALLPCLYGAAMEIVQGAMSAGRTGSLFDILANIFGASLAVGVWWVFVKYIWKSAG